MACNWKEFLLENWFKIVMFIFFIIILGIEIHQLKREYMDTSSADYIARIKFKGFFRDDDQQTSWFSHYEKSKITNVCCSSNTTWSAPTLMRDIHGKERVITQFPDQKQFYYTELCVQIPDCTVCNCEQQSSMLSLVYEEINSGVIDYLVGLFPAPQCCKCLRIDNAN